MTRRALADLASLLAIVALIGIAYLLPPDTSLRIVRERGVLRVCVPEEYPPLVTSARDLPGIDVELVQGVAERLGVRLQLVENYAIGRDFDPRSWRLTRAQCQLIAGGVVASETTRSFLETTPPHLSTGWAAVVPELGAVTDFANTTIAFLPGSTGLDRIALSRFLRRQGAAVRLVQDEATAVAALEGGDVDAIVTEALQARSLAGTHGFSAVHLTDESDRLPITLGLWKGDLTLKRAITSALEAMEEEGALDRIRERYELAPIVEECPFCG